MNRFDKAQICINGACNPRRVAMALVESIDEARAEGVDDVTIKTDPAVVLILDQLMQLLGSYGGTGSERFSAAYNDPRMSPAKE